MSIGVSVLSILAQCLSNRSQQVMVGSCRSKLVNVVPQESVFSSLLFLLFTSERFSILENKFIGYAVDSTLNGCCAIPRHYRAAVAESLNRDLFNVSLGITFGQQN